MAHDGTENPAGCHSYYYYSDFIYPWKKHRTLFNYYTNITPTNPTNKPPNQQISHSFTQSAVRRRGRCAGSGAMLVRDCRGGGGVRGAR